MIFRAVLAVVLLISVTVEAAEGDVTFWMDKVTLHCPENGIWFKGIGNKGERRTDLTEAKTYTYIYKGQKDQYTCEYDSGKLYFFYIQGKACPNCFELDGLVFAVVIVADIIGTVVVMALVFKCTKAKPAGPQRATKATHRSNDIQLNSPYAPLSRHTRSHDEYSVIHKTG